MTNSETIHRQETALEISQKRPAVLQDLSGLLPLYAAAYPVLPKTHESHAALTVAVGARAKLLQALQAWYERHALKEAWLLDAAIGTLHHWAEKGLDPEGKLQFHRLPYVAEDVGR